MTTLKIDSKVSPAAADALEIHIPGVYARPGARVLAVMEMQHIERTQPAPESDSKASVKMRITHLEVPSKDQEGVIREVLRALHLHRTATGTLDEDGDIVLSDQTLKTAAGVLTAIETARLRAGLEHHAHAARHLANTSKELTASEFRHELAAIADALDAVLSRAALDDGDGD